MRENNGHNPMASALDTGVARRRRPGERVYAGAITDEEHKRVSVDIPTALYRDAKVFAAQSGVTVKQIMVSGLQAELERRRSG